MTWTDFLQVHWMELLLLPVLLAAAAFFNASETSMFNLTRAQLYRLSHAGRLGRLVNSLMERPRRVLNTVLLGTMLATTGYAGTSAVLVLALAQMGLPAYGLAGLSLLPVLAMILVGEIAPKTLALAMGEPLAVGLASPLALASKAFAPLLWGMERIFVGPLTALAAPRTAGRNINADELAALLDLSVKRGVINLEVNTLLQEVVSLTNIYARDIMIPRVDMVACDAAATPEQVGELFRKTRLRRIPVYEGDLDHLLGILHAKRFLLNPGTPIRSLLTKATFVPEAANIERVLLQFRVTRTQMAIVVDEYGGTAGLVTLEDVLEEIVGEIPDPNAAERYHVERISNREYLIDGELGIHQWADVFPTDLSRGRISTVGGFVTSLLGRLPKPGDRVTYRNLKFTVESMRRRRIEKLRLELMEGGA